ncbi:MAG: hypothetical protein Q9203_004184 [Teloschistes exilis]
MSSSVNPAVNVHGAIYTDKQKTNAQRNEPAMPMDESLDLSQTVSEELELEDWTPEQEPSADEMDLTEVPPREARTRPLPQFEPVEEDLPETHFPTQNVFRSNRVDRLQTHDDGLGGELNVLEDQNAALDKTNGAHVTEKRKLSRSRKRRHILCTDIRTPNMRSRICQKPLTTLASSGALDLLASYWRRGRLALASNDGRGGS